MPLSCSCLLIIILAIWSGRQHHARPVTPRALCPRGLIEGETWDEEIDIWSLDCLVQFYLQCLNDFSSSANCYCIYIGISICHKPTTFPSGKCRDAQTRRLVNEPLRSQIHRLIDKSTQCEALMDYLSERLPSDFGRENIHQLVSFVHPNAAAKSTRPQVHCQTTQLSHPFLPSSTP